jgi:Nuclease-related domain
LRLVFNKMTLEPGTFIRFHGKPVMSAQIDTLVITKAGESVIEVKNWSRQFANSGEGFNAACPSGHTGWSEMRAPLS